MKKSTLPLVVSLLSPAAFGVVNLDFGSATVTGQPDDPGGMRFNDVAPGIDLVIEAVGPYSAFNTSENGISGDFGSVNLLGNTTSSFTFSLFDADTTTLATVDQVTVSFLDLDGANAAGPFESITILDPAQYTLSDPTEILVDNSTPGELTFSSEVVAFGANNPTSTTLTTGQSELAVSVTYLNLSQFTFDFASGNAGAGRNVLFAGNIVFPGSTTTEGFIPEPNMSFAAGALALILGLRSRRS